ncbi:RING-HC_RNF170 domain-containing protein [Scomber scombrus]|uniref:RING-HC_RNF170 domain-containing protein n=1 Tax=Scomber scombrus TaxID=13677 RepID=A0AAV1PTZ1_SCOSC
MNPHSSSQSRLDHLPSEGLAGQCHPGSSRSLVCQSEQSASAYMSCHKTANFPVQTNSPCLIAYWRHGSWLDAISCPLCRQKVSVLCHLFNESRSDRQSKEVLGEITDYNKRYSGAPRRVTDYLCDAPLLLQLLARGLGTIGGLVWLFFFRVALCCVGTVVSISSTSLDSVSSSSNPLETDPSFCGLLGVLDDLVVVILLLICVININQQMAPERGHSANAATSQGVMGDSL